MHPIHVDTFDITLIVSIRKVSAYPNLFDRWWRILYTESHAWFVDYKLFAMNRHLNPFPNRHILLTSYHTNTSSILYILWYLLMQTYYFTLFFFYTCIYLAVHKTLDLFAVTLLGVYHSHNSASQSTVTNTHMHPYIETLRYTHSYYLSHLCS